MAPILSTCSSRIDDYWKAMYAEDHVMSARYGVKDLSFLVP